MKIKNFIFVMILSAIMSLCVMHGRLTARSSEKVVPARTAIVSIRKVLAESEKNVAFEKNITEEARKVKEQLREIESEIAQDREVLSRFKPTSRDYRKRSQAIMEKELKLEAQKKSFQQQFEARQQTWAEESFKAVLKQTEKVAESKGYDLVLAKEDYQWPSVNANELMMVIKTSKVLYHSEHLDITDEVLEAWNNADFNVDF